MNSTNILGYSTGANDNDSEDLEYFRNLIDSKV